MSVRVQCEHCGAQFNLKDETKIGKRMKCPKCQVPFVATAADDDFDDFGGAPLPSKKSGGGKNSKKGKKRKKQSAGVPVAALAIGGGVLLLALILVVIWLVLPSEPRPAAPPVAAADRDAADVEATSSEDEGEAEAEAPVEEKLETGLPVAWLPDDTELIVQIQPARLLEAPLLKPLVESEGGREFLASFKEQSGFGLTDVESITIGVAAMLDSIPTGFPGATRGAPALSPEDEADFGAEDMDAEGGNSSGPVSNVVTVMVLKNSVQPERLPFLVRDSGGNESDDADDVDESRKPGEVVYSIKPPPAQPGSGPGAMGSPMMVPDLRTMSRQMGATMPNPKTLVIADKRRLSHLKREPDGSLAGRFAFAQEKAGLVLALSLESVPRLQETLNRQAAMLPPEAQGSLNGPLEFYEKGARGVFLAINVSEGAEIGVGVGGKDAESARALREELQGRLDGFRDDAERQMASLPRPLRALLLPILESLDPWQEETLVSLTVNFDAEAIDQLQRQAQQAVAGLLMAGLGGPSFGGPGEGMLAGMFGGAGDGRRIVSGEPQPAASSEGLPEGLALTAVTGWSLPEDSSSPAAPHEEIGQQAPGAADFEGNFDALQSLPPEEQMRRLEEMAAGRAGGAEGAQGAGKRGKPVVTLDLILEGSLADRVVQFRELTLERVLAANGKPLKRRGVGPFVPTGPESWFSTESVRLEDEGIDGYVIPLQFDPPGEIDALTEVSGQALLRVAGEVQEIEIDLASLSGPRPGQGQGGQNAGGLSQSAQMQLQQLMAAGVRMVPVSNAAVRSFYIGPFSDETVIVEIRSPGVQVGGPVLAGARGMSASGGAGGGYQPASADEFAEATADESGLDADDAEYAGSMRGRGQGELAEAIAIRRPDHASPEGYVVEVGQSGTLIVRVARNVREETVRFSFRDLSLPERESSLGEPDLPWTEIASGESLPDGVTAVMARGEWAEPNGESRRRTLNLMIDVVGPLAPKATAVGIYQLNECVADDNRRLTLDENNSLFRDRPVGFDTPDRALPAMNAPPDTFRVFFPLNAIEPAFSSIVKMSGGFRLKVASERLPITILDLKAFENKRILHEELTAEKVFLTLSQKEGMITVNLPQRQRDSVAGIDLIDRTGRLDGSVTREIVSEKNDDQYRFYVGERTLDQLGLRIVLNKGVKVVRVPFAFESIPVPPATPGAD